MKTQTLLSSLLVAMILSAGCAAKSSDIVDENGESGQKTKTVQGDTAGAKSTENGTITSENKDNKAQDLNGENQDQNVQNLTAVEDQAQTIYFDYDKFAIRTDMQDRLEANAVLLKEARVKVEGNCDEWGSDEYNFALGLKRAVAVKKALIAQGLKADNISPLSLGETAPVCSDKTQACWSKNRRVDFKVLP